MYIYLFLRLISCMLYVIIYSYMIAADSSTSNIWRDEDLVLKVMDQSLDTVVRLLYRNAIHLLVFLFVTVMSSCCCNCCLS